jgi:cysteine synthase A
MSNWVHRAIQAINADFQRSADTHLIRVDIPGCPDVDLYLKDESTHPTGSLKHRLARSLFLYGLCNGWIKEDTPIIESSSGSTAVSEAYFARLLKLPFIAVMPVGTSPKKVKAIEFYGGRCQFVEASMICEASHKLASELKGHYMDQFTFAERATDWRGNNNIAESIYEQMSKEPHPVPSWVVMSAGTGGTTATIGRYIRYDCHPTRLCLADPENSVFARFFETRDPAVRCGRASRIEGIGRHRPEPSFKPDVIDRALIVKDEAAIAAIRVLENLLNRKCGGSTGTNLVATWQIMSEMQRRGESGSVVTMICDAGDRYLDTYYDNVWVASQGLKPELATAMIERFVKNGAELSELFVV